MNYKGKAAYDLASTLYRSAALYKLIATNLYYTHYSLFSLSHTFKHIGAQAHTFDGFRRISGYFHGYLQDPNGSLTLFVDG